MSHALNSRDFEFEYARGAHVWRVSPATRIFDFPDWSSLDGQPSRNRWDDPEGNFRTLYFGDSPFACFVEVLACFRPDSTLVDDLDNIDDAFSWGPRVDPGVVPAEWVATRSLGSARLTGWFVVIGHSSTVAAIRPHFLALASNLGFADFDGASLRAHAPRALTQRIARFVYGTSHQDGQPCNGIRFYSRHGDDLGLWALFEYSEEHSTYGEMPGALSDMHQMNISPDDPDLLRAINLLGLRLGTSTQ